MIYGVGTDILKISNISSCVSEPSDPFVRRSFTEAETELILSREKPLYSFATRFAGKEAVFKCLDLGGNDISLRDIEILENDKGKPLVFLHGRAAALASEKGIARIHISLSYDTDYATAYALAETGN